MERIFAIGDIHGCFDKLKELMDKIDIDMENDRLLFIGDYIDRGSQSFEVVEYLIDLKERYPKTVFLRGNHEDMLEKYLQGPDKYTYLVNGGQQTLENYLQHNREGAPAIPRKHLDFFSSLRLYYETELFIFVHAGMRKKILIENQDAEDLLWIRGPFIKTDYNFGRRVVFGHTPFPEPLVMPNKIGIDTGAVYGNKLTCVKLPELQFFSA